MNAHGQVNSPHSSQNYNVGRFIVRQGVWSLFSMLRSTISRTKLQAARPKDQAGNDMTDRGFYVSDYIVGKDQSAWECSLERVDEH
jgi:hypothetical protein